MKNIKSIVAVMLLLCMAVSLCACTAADPTGTTNSKAPVATTTKPAPTEKPTEKPTEPTTDGKVDYTITVLNPDGTPAVDAWIMVCTDEKCFTPKGTDANGVVVFRLEQMDGYKAKLDGEAVFDLQLTDLNGVKQNFMFRFHRMVPPMINCSFILSIPLASVIV